MRGNAQAQFTCCAAVLYLWYNFWVPTNIEIKLRVNELAAVEQKAALISDSGPTHLEQNDVFFQAPAGRLKLRRFQDGSAELIAYQRADADTVRESSWLAYPTTEPDQLESVLTKAIGKGIVVSKKRTLYIAGNTRIHLDEVDGLGCFVELEVVLDAELSTSQAENIALELIQKLGLESSQRISVAYADLLAAEF